MQNIYFRDEQSQINERYENVLIKQTMKSELALTLTTLYLLLKLDGLYIVIVVSLSKMQRITIPEIEHLFLRFDDVTFRMSASSSRNFTGKYFRSDEEAEISATFKPRPGAGWRRRTVRKCSF